MMFRKKENWDDGWDDDEIDEPRRTGSPSPPAKREIIWVLVIVVIAALLVGKLVSRDKFQLTEVPEPLIGAWVCGDPARSEAWIEFRRQALLMSTSGTSSVKYRILGIDHERVSGIDRYTVYYKDLAGKDHTMEMRMAEAGDLRFVDDPATLWTPLNQ